jgi:hypothetical protein
MMDLNLKLRLNSINAKELMWAGADEFTRRIGRNDPHKLLPDKRIIGSIYDGKGWLI